MTDDSLMTSTKWDAVCSLNPRASNDGGRDRQRGVSAIRLRVPILQPPANFPSRELPAGHDFVLENDAQQCFSLIKKV